MSAPDAGPALRLSGVEVAYGPRTALHEVDLQVPRGEFLALTGPNGSGKSTLLRAALGLVPVAGGTVELLGSPVDRLSVRERAQRVAWVPQAEPLREDVPLERYVLYGRYALHGTFGRESSTDRERVTALLREVGLADRALDGILSLSGGERQRAVLARALAQETPLLLLDEPTTHLDIGHQLDLLSRVRALVNDRGLTVVAALHDLNLAARYAQRVVVLHRGRLVADGAPRVVLSPRLLFDVWGVASELRYDARTQLPYLLPRTPAPTPPAPGEMPAPTPRAHVIGGGGSAGDLLRRLVDAGFRVSAGALPLFDSDTAVAAELDVPVVLELPFAPISPETRAQLRVQLGSSDLLVLAPFPVGPANLANLEEAAAYAKPQAVYLLRQAPGATWDFTGGSATALREEIVRRGAREVSGPDELVRALRARTRT